MTDNTCNGWRNAATWTVNLWFGDHFTAATEDGIDVTAEYCRQMVDDYVEMILNSASISQHDAAAGFIWDMLDLNSVDWDELASHHEIMMEEPETDWVS
jgi:hypothetical protein